MSFEKYIIKEAAEQRTEAEILRMITDLVEALETRQKFYDGGHNSIQYKDRWDDDDKWSVEVYRQLSTAIRKALPELKNLNQYFSGTVDSMLKRGRRMRS